MEGDPSRIPSHDFDDDDAPVRLRSRVQSIDGIGGKAHRRVESKAARRSDDVVVDRLGHADEGNALLVELVRDGQGAVAADADERAKARPLEHLHHAVGVDERALGRRDRPGERIPAIDRAEDGAAEPEDARHIPRREQTRFLGIDEAVEAVFEAEHFDAGVVRRLDDRANDRVETWSVAAAGQHADFFYGGHECGLVRRAVGMAYMLHSDPSRFSRIGRLAQLGERCVRNAEVRGSIPLPSTSLRWRLALPASARQASH